VDIHFLAAVAGAYLAAGFVKGVIGMGLPAVALGLLGLLVTPAQAAAILIVPSLATNVWQGLAGGALRELLRRLWPLFLGACIGTFIGALTLPRGNGEQATRWLGLVLAVYAALGLAKVHFLVPQRAQGWIGISVGLVTGVVAVATGMFAIPSVFYINGLGLDRDRLVQALGLSFTVSTIALGAALYEMGELNVTLAWPALTAVVAAIAGMALGQLLRGRIAPQTFRLWFFIALLLLGVRLALRGLI
jgi:uncharacterized membrane protein YfcA